MTYSPYLLFLLGGVSKDTRLVMGLISFSPLPYRKGGFIVDLKLLLGIKITLPAADGVEVVVIVPSNKIEMRINWEFLS